MREGLEEEKWLKRKKRERERRANAVILMKVGVLTASLKLVVIVFFVCLSRKCRKKIMRREKAQCNVMNNGMERKGKEERRRYSKWRERKGIEFGKKWI